MSSVRRGSTAEANDRNGSKSARPERVEPDIVSLSAKLSHRRTVVTRACPKNLRSALARRLGGPADAIPAIAALFVETFLQMLRVR